MNQGRRRLMRSSNGFTAIELVLSMMILGIIVLPLVSSFVLSIGTTAEANQRTQNNSDAQLMSSYFARDTASAENVAVSNPLTSTTKEPSTCGVAGDLLVRFDWTASSSTTRYVAYVVQENVPAESEIKTTSATPPTVYKIVRVYCENKFGSGPAVSELTLANTVKGPEPTLLCDGSACSTASAPGVLSSPPQLLSFQVSEYQRNATDTPFTFMVQGARRVNS